MNTYSIVLAHDVPHYGTAEIEATDAAQALERAKELDLSEACLDPDWENTVCARIVHIEDGAGVVVAENVVLDGYILHHDSEPRAALYARSNALLAALEKIAAIPLWSKRVTDTNLRSEFLARGEYEPNERNSNQALIRKARTSRAPSRQHARRSLPYL